MRKLEHDLESDETLMTQLNSLRCKARIQTHHYKTLCEVNQVLKWRMGTSLWEDFQIIQFMVEIED